MNLCKQCSLKHQFECLPWYLVYLKNNISNNEIKQKYVFLKYYLQTLIKNNIKVMHVAEIFKKIGLNKEFILGLLYHLEYEIKTKHLLNSRRGFKKASLHDLNIIISFFAYELQNHDQIIRIIDKYVLMQNPEIYTKSGKNLVENLAREFKSFYLKNNITENLPKQSSTLLQQPDVKTEKPLESFCDPHQAIDENENKNADVKIIKSDDDSFPESFFETEENGYDSFLTNNENNEGDFSDYCLLSS